MTRPRTLSELAEEQFARDYMKGYQWGHAFAWRLRGWLAVPFVWVLRWLYPSALDRGDQ